MVNELYEDDEGFYKNHYQYATENTDGTFTVGVQIPETSSYTNFSDAVTAFEKFIKNEKSSGGGGLHSRLYTLY